MWPTKLCARNKEYGQYIPGGFDLSHMDRPCGPLSVIPTLSEVFVKVQYQELALRHCLLEELISSDQLTVD